MKILVIGGSGFIGPNVIRQLVAQGHQVTLFHRGNTQPDLPGSVERILGDRNQLEAHRPGFERRRFDAVIDIVLSDQRQAHQLMDVFRGIAGRVVVLSSGDVYRAYGVLLGNDPGPPQPTPLTEESELRTQPPYQASQLRLMQSIFSWLTAEYDKVPVERAVMSDARLPATVLRLPMVYGPGDPLHRLFPILKRVADQRPAMLIQEDAGGLHPPRGYVENVAAAIVLAAVSDQAAGRVYNVAESDSPSETDWMRIVAEAAGWNGAVIPLPKDKLPRHLAHALNTAQDWLTSSQRIRQELGFREPVPLAMALQRTVAWERSNPPAKIDPGQFDYTAEDAAFEQHRPV